MRRLLPLLALLLVLPAAGAQDAVPDPRPEKRPGARSDVPGALRIEEPHVRFADRHQHATVRHRFALRNAGDVTVRIERAIALDGSGEVTPSTDVLAPGEAAAIDVVQPLDEPLGESAFRYALVSDEPGVARYRFSLSGFVESAYDPERPQLRFGTVSRDAGGRAELELGSREVAALEVEEILSDDPLISLEVLGPAGDAGQTLRLAATLAPGAPPGLLSGRLTLRTNVPRQPRIDVVYTASVFADVVAGANPVDLGTVEVGGEGEAAVVLESRTGAPVRVAALEDEAGLVDARARPCAADDAEEAPCRRIVLRVAPVAPGPLTGTLVVRFAGDEPPLPLRYYGLAVAPGTRIRSIDLSGGEEGGS